MNGVLSAKYAEAVAAIAHLATLYPKAFFVYEIRRKPLKLDIHHDLTGVMPESELSMALGMYTKNTGYMRNMREGVERIDLSGNPVGVVSAEHAAGAAGWVKARMRCKLEAARERKLEAAHKSYTEAWATDGIMPTRCGDDAEGAKSAVCCTEADRILVQARRKPVAKRKLKLKSSEPLPRVLHLADLGALRSRGLVP